MSVAHAPSVSAMAGGFAVVICVVSLQLTASSFDVSSITWLSLIWLAVALRVWVVFCVKRAHDNTLPRWNQLHQLSTAFFGIAWGAALWLLPIDTNRELMISLVGIIAGLTAAGSTMAPADKRPTRAWFVPTLILEAIFCIKDNTAIGWFGATCILGLIVLLWIQSGLNHHNTGELLGLRFASEAVANARTQALAEAKELGLAKEQFLATMSHEMRTPLHGILGLSRLIRNDVSTPDVHKKLDLQLKAGEHLLRMINDVLDLSRLHANRMVLRPEPTDLHALAQEVADITQATVQDKPIRIHVQAEGLPAQTKWQVDASRLKQILINLAGNAAKFTAHGEVRIVIRLDKKRKPTRSSDKLIFEVCDTGIGIPTKDIDRIFMPFQQVTSAKHGGVGGTGLGLSIAVQLCEAMKSQLHCESKEGEGTRFWFTTSLPRVAIVEPKQTRLRPKNAAPDPSSGAIQGIVLVVDDNPVNVLIARAQVELFGLQCKTADSGKSALAWLEGNPCDLVLLDYHMPGMNGDEVAKRMHAICQELYRRSVPIVAMTAAYEGLDSFTEQKEIVGILHKPFSEEELLAVLKRHMPLVDHKTVSQVTSMQRPITTPGYRPVET